MSKTSATRKRKLCRLREKLTSVARLSRNGMAIALHRLTFYRVNMSGLIDMRPYYGEWKELSFSDLGTKTISHMQRLTWEPEKPMSPLEQLAAVTRG